LAKRTNITPRDLNLLHVPEFSAVFNNYGDAGIFCRRFD
jgi:hypothetical protein